MNSPQNILVIIDPTASEHPAVAKAALLAHKFGSKVELFACDDEASRHERWLRNFERQEMQSLGGGCRPLLDQLAAPLRQQGLDVNTDTIEVKSHCAGLVEKIASTHADLVVKDTHHHTLAKRTLLTNTDWQLIRRCCVPLLLVKHSVWSQQPRILAAIDPGIRDDKSPVLDHEILEWAAALDSAFKGETHVLHAYLPTAVVTTVAGLSPIAIAPSAEEIAAELEVKRKELNALCSAYGIDKLHLQMGAAGTLLPEKAVELQADIVVMGAISRHGIRRLLIGSTAERVLDRLPCDVLIVKPLDFAVDLPF